MTFEELGLDLKHFIETNQLSNVVLLGHSFGARNIWAYLQH
jgi:pimeloyl-ACP methyl ester carboxylesterase